MGLQSRNGCGFVMLPQTPEGAGYYVHGTPGRGTGFGVGNIILASGPEFIPHKSHRYELQIDVPAPRVDGKHVGVAWRSAEYDRAATARLITLFSAHPSVSKVLFDDSTVPGVFPKPRHDDHFHVEERRSR